MAEVVPSLQNDLIELKAADKTVIPVVRPPKPVEPVKPTFGETVQADFVANNFLFNAITKPYQNDFTHHHDFDPNFNPYQMDKYKGYEGVVAEAANEQHADELVIHQQLRNEAKQTLADADGWNTFGAGIVSGGLDLDTLLLIPLAPEMFIGKTLLRTGVKSAVVSGAATTAKELGFQALDTDRTMEESAISVGSSAGFGAAGSVIYQAITGVSSKAIANKILGPNTSATPAQQTQLAQTIQDIYAPPSPSLGAAGVGHTTIEEEAVRGTSAMVNLPGIRTPNTDLAQTPFSFMREIKQDLAVDPFLREKNFQGIAQPIDAETTIFQQSASLLGECGVELDKATKVFSKATLDGNVLADEFARLGIKDIDLAAVRVNPSKFQTATNFRRLISGALRNGDTSAVKEVEQVATHVRAKIIQPLGQGALDRGMFDDIIEAAGKKAEQKAVTTHPEAKVKTTLESLKSSEEATLKALRSTPKSATRDADILAVKTRLKDIEAKLDISEKNLAAAVVKAGEDARLNARNLKSPTSLTYLHRIWNHDAVIADQQGLRKVIAKHVAHTDDPQGVEDDIMATLLNLDRPTSLHQVDLHGKAAPLKERLLMIPDNELAPWLVNDLQTIVHKFTKDLVTDITFKDKFGDKNLTNVLEQARVLFDSHVRQTVAKLTAEGKTTDQINKAVAKLTDQFQADKDNIDFLLKQIVGQTGGSDRLSKLTSSTFSAVKKLNTLRLLGSMAIANLTDFGRIVGVDGITRFIPALLHYSKRVVGATEFTKMTKAQAHEIGIGLQNVIDNRMIQMMDVLSHEQAVNAGKLSKLNRALDWTLDKFQYANGMRYLVTMEQDLVATLNSNRLARTTSKYTGLSKNDKAWLAQHYIDEQMAARIAAEIKAHGVEKNGFQFSNLDKWTDPEAAMVFKSAVWKSTFHSLVTPHAGSLPQWMRSPIGSIATQFQSFLAAAHEQMTIAGIGQRDMLAMQGFLGVVFMASVAAQARSFVKTGAPIEDDKQWLVNTVDAAGFGALPFYGGVLTEITNRATGVADNKRYRDIPDVGARFLGPTYGAANAGYSAFSDIMADGDMKDSSIHKLRQLAPFQNIFWLRSTVFDPVEEKMKEAFGGGR